MLWNKDQTDPSIRITIFSSQQIRYPAFNKFKYCGPTRKSDDLGGGDTRRLIDLDYNELTTRFIRYPGTDICLATVEFLDITPLVESLNLGVPPGKLLPCGRARILIREEYNQLKQSLQKQQLRYQFRDHESVQKTIPVYRPSEREHLVVHGHAGLGKSCFLSYILVERLLKGLVTVFVHSTGSHVIFAPEGAFYIPNIRDIDSAGASLRQYYSDGSVWYLSETEPDGYVGLESQTDWMIVQMYTSGDTSSGGWQKQHSIPGAFVSPWPWVDICALALFYLNPDGMYRLYRLFDIYGPIPKVLLDDFQPLQWDYGVYYQDIMDDRIEAQARLLVWRDPSGFMFANHQYPDEIARKDFPDLVIFGTKLIKDKVFPVKQFKTAYIVRLIMMLVGDEFKKACLDLFLKEDEDGDSGSHVDDKLAPSYGWIYAELLHFINISRTCFVELTIVRVAGWRKDPMIVHIAPCTEGELKFRDVGHLKPYLMDRQDEQRCDPKKMNRYMRQACANSDGIDALYIDSIGGRIWVFNMAVGRGGAIFAESLEWLFWHLPKEVQDMEWGIIHCDPDKKRDCNGLTLIENMGAGPRLDFWRSTERWYVLDRRTIEGAIQ
ncbi:hypothetical protein TWF730_000425 [Orbilia blumenaviensis]|uniref:Uncharacterized protein n=1 Tax=Orbilia blumenaviensis TaxID=1796055 RepID=A0AAV9VMT4_9PEZI